MKFNDSYLFAEYFDETCDKISEFSASNWLKMLDTDSLQMLSQYMENFSETTDIEDVNQNQAEDTILLVKKIYVQENGLSALDVALPPTNTLIETLGTLVIFESLRRKDLLEINGDGKMRGSTSVKLTQDGQTIQSHLKETS